VCSVRTLCGWHALHKDTFTSHWWSTEHCAFCSHSTTATNPLPTPPQLSKNNCQWQKYSLQYFRGVQLAKMTLVRFSVWFCKKLRFSVRFWFYKINCGFRFFRFVFLHWVLFDVYAVNAFQFTVLSLFWGKGSINILICISCVVLTCSVHSWLLLNYINILTRTKWSRLLLLYLQSTSELIVWFVVSFHCHSFDHQWTRMAMYGTWHINTGTWKSTTAAKPITWVCNKSHGFGLRNWFDTSLSSGSKTVKSVAAFHTLSHQQVQQTVPSGHISFVTSILQGSSNDLFKVWWDL